MWMDGKETLGVEPSGGKKNRRCACESGCGWRGEPNGATGLLLTEYTRRCGGKEVVSGIRDSSLRFFTCMCMGGGKDPELHSCQYVDCKPFIGQRLAMPTESATTLGGQGEAHKSQCSQ